jgi:hypothetical protein
MNELLSDEFVAKLEDLAKAGAAEYQANSPYPHIISIVSCPSR